MVILVDKDDNPTGEMEKIEAHRKALLHRAFSVFIFNTKGELLLQRRAANKYHSGGLWTNTCCSHPYPGEETDHAAHRRLMEEMGMDTDLEYIRKFIYKAPFDNALTEHELDHIFIGITDDRPHINPDEVSEYKYMSLPDLERDIKEHPEQYSAWFYIILEKFMQEISKTKARH